MNLLDMCINRNRIDGIPKIPRFTITYNSQSLTNETFLKCSVINLLLYNGLYIFWLHNIIAKSSIYNL